MFTITLLAACWLADPPKTTAYDKLLVEQREAITEEWKKALADAEKAVPELKKKAVQARYSIRQAPRAKKKEALELANAADEAAKQAEERLRELRKNDPPFVPSFGKDYDFKKSRIGRLAAPRIIQRFSDTEALCELSYTLWVPRPGVPQVRGNITLDPLHEKIPFVLRDRATINNRSDGDVLDPLPGDWIVIGTTTYSTVAGSQKTVPVLETFKWPGHQDTAAKGD